MPESSCAARKARRSSSSSAVLRFGAAASEQVAGQVGQPLLAVRLDVLARARQDDDVHQRQLAVRDDVGHGAALERDAEVCRVRGLVGAAAGR